MAQPPSQALLTDRELSQCPFPHLPARLSQRRSKSRTQHVAPRTFEGVESWPGFMDGVAGIARRLDNNVASNGNPWKFWRNGLQPAADEIAVRGALEQVLFPQINDLALKLGMDFIYDSGGSGRSFSYTDLVIIDKSQSQSSTAPLDLSHRVYGNGEAKGPWQWDLGNDSFEEALNRDTKKQKMCTDVLQQLFGDMVLDETMVGYISNYNQTVFFKRLDGRSKSLQFSPVVKVDDAPVEKFLFVLDFVEQNKHLKPLFSRTIVKDTPPGGYTINLPLLSTKTSSGRTTKRKGQTLVLGATPKKRKGDSRDANVPEFYDEEHLSDIPTYPMDELGITGEVVGMGKYGNVMAGQWDGQKMALKTYDLRVESAVLAFVREQMAYHYLRPLQGRCIPVLSAVGRLPHSNVIFLGLTDEGQKDVAKPLASRRREVVELQVLQMLDEIHGLGVLHGDLKLSHVLWRNNGPRFIDFESSNVNARKEDLDLETKEMEELLSECT